VTSSLIPDLCKRVLRISLNSLWNFIKVSNEGGNSAPLPSYVAFTNSVMTQGIREHDDLTVRVIGRCVGALVASKLAANVDVDIVSVRDDELACISAILGVRSDDVIPLLHHPGAIEFTNIIFLACTNDDSASVRLHSKVLGVVQQTFSILSQVLPAELDTAMRLDQTDTLMNVSDGQCRLILLPCPYGLKECISDLFTRL
jgi:hypothetical protein